MFEDRYKISVEDIKGKELELMNKFIKEVLKYKEINQVELGGIKNFQSFSFKGME